MTSDARRALALIRACIEMDHYALSMHFSERMEQRGLFWPDVQAVIYNPNEVRTDGVDRFNRPKWIIRGEAADSGEIEIICAMELDETEFITLYWES